MNKNLVMIGAVLALIGLIVNVVFDLDNAYDMTLAGLWVLTLLVVAAGAFMGGMKPMGGMSMSGSQQFKCAKCGASFGNQSELDDHVKKMHPM
ncbi:MAG: C2H2-type zinc finger protein [Thaumarchaeota archaeon]|nr:C2H2-type zinc finger protein [Nitrososphaerota archaeon]